MSEGICRVCSVGRDQKPGCYHDKHAGITVACTERAGAVARLPRTTLEAGQSGNPSGQTAEYGDVVRLARSLSLRAVDRLGELMESEDERVAAVACSAVLDRAFGKPQTRQPEKEDSLAERLDRMTPEERGGRYALDLAERVRRRLADAGITIGHEPKE
jgi:hypothetical protein